MKKSILLLFCLWSVFFLLTACGSDDEGKAGKESPPAQVSGQAAQGIQAPGAAASAPAGQPSEASDPATPPAAPVPSLTPEERKKADALVAFFNAASSTLASGRYTLPDALMANARVYLREWRLAPRPKVRSGADAAARLAPPRGLFPAQEEARLAHYVQDMGKALDSMLAEYRALEKYLADDSIQDDGVKGKALVESLGRGHAVFMAARDGFLEIVEARAARAEEMLLQEHPLKRQILQAGKIFSLFRKAASLLAPEKPDQAQKEALRQLRQELDAAIAVAGRPPFPAAPEVERSFRAFLKEATLFSRSLERGLGEGFYSPLRRDLNDAALRSREAYNAFVREANQA